MKGSPFAFLHCHYPEKEISVNAIFSSSLLAASMFFGQATEPSAKSAVPAPPTMQPTQPAQQPRGPILGFFSREDRPILHKIQGWFKRDQQDTKKDVPNNIPAKDIRETPPMINPTPPAPASNDFPRKLPNPSSKATTKPDVIVKDAPPAMEIQQASLKQVGSANTAKSPILALLANRIGRDEKFEWITGQLEIENGSHVLYYATPETIDKYSGRIVLQPQQTDMSQFRRGDLISVRGQMGQSKTAQGMIPAYRVSSASLIERPKL
jgi:hypothetical protein